jgi:hypothetical protein
MYIYNAYIHTHTHAHQEPSPDSYIRTDLLGNMDPCFTVSIAKGAVLQVSAAGWTKRSPSVCIRYGQSTWRNVSGQTVTTASAVIPTLFTPISATSDVPVTITVRGTGFTRTGSRQTRIKITGDDEPCARLGTGDASTVVGGSGKACETVTYDVVSGLQTCTVTFDVATPVTVRASLCLRTGMRAYQRVGTDTLVIQPWNATTLTPTTLSSNSPYTVTIHGRNFGPQLAREIRAKLCPLYVCLGGDALSNAGEPCAGQGDTTTCVSSSVCSNNTLCDSDDAEAGSFQGGEAVKLASSQGCNSEERACTRMIFNFFPVSMTDTTAGVWMRFRNASYNRVPGADIAVSGSYLHAVEMLDPQQVCVCVCLSCT